MKQSLLIVGLFLGSLSAAFAQQDSTRTKKTAPGRQYKGFALGEVTTPQGRKVRVYLPTDTNGFQDAISFYDQSPETRPYPKKKMISVDKIHTMVVEDIYSETMVIGGKSEKVLATRVLNGPVELFYYKDDEARYNVTPNGSMVASKPVLMTNHWYVRRSGELVEVKRFKFREQMTEYLKDYSELAQKIQQDLPDYQYRDMRAIIAQYNLMLAANTSK